MNGLLSDDHSQLDALISELFARLETGDAALVFEKLDLFWARLAMHIRAEHLHLFPAVLGALDSGMESLEQNRFVPTLEKAQNRISGLRDDHDFFMRELGSAIKQMRLMRENGLPDEAERLFSIREKITKIHRRLERHNELEESEVYQWAETLLDSSARAGLNERMQKELNNLPPRFTDS